MEADGTEHQVNNLLLCVEEKGNKLDWNEDRPACSGRLNEK